MRSFHDLLETRRPLLGTFSTLGSPDALEIACHAGLDFVIIDGQHGALGGASLAHLLRAADAAGCFAIARLPAHGLSQVEGLLDAGYPALLAPMVNAPEHAADLASAAFYPPRGMRSQSTCRASLRHGPDYRRIFNDAFTLIVMIEHIAGLEALERILAVPGIGAIFVGPTDLASSLADSAPERLEQAIAEALSLCLAAHVPIGIAARDAAEAARRARQGFHFIAVATDRRFLAAALAAEVEKARQAATAP